jgi:hypothetical protein
MLSSKSVANTAYRKAIQHFVAILSMQYLSLYMDHLARLSVSLLHKWRKKDNFKSSLHFKVWDIEINLEWAKWSVIDLMAVYTCKSLFVAFKRK